MPPRQQAGHLRRGQHPDLPRAIGRRSQGRCQPGIFQNVTQGIPGLLTGVNQGPAKVPLIGHMHLRDGRRVGFQPRP